MSKLDFRPFAVARLVGALSSCWVFSVIILSLGCRTSHLDSPSSNASAAAFCPTVGHALVTKALAPIRQKYDLPAMAVAVVTSDGLKYSGAVGVRKRGTAIPVALDDLWHLGSDGKVMTSTLVARLVEKGQLNWSLTLGEAFPDLAAGMHADFRAVTLLHLLSHRAGLPANLDLHRYDGEDASALRLQAVREELSHNPQSAPGSTFLYSNLGYILAGAVIERRTGRSWERLMADELFTPLHMTTAGIGGTGTPGVIDQPWPHERNAQPTETNGPRRDNPPVMGPAGRIHCSMKDWARFIQDQLRGARGESALLSPDSYRKVQTAPFGGDYALGWQISDREWAGGKTLSHVGDNTMNYANAWIAPQRDFAILVCVNQSGSHLLNATDEAVRAMIALLDEQTGTK